MILSDDAEYVRAPLVGRSTGDGLYLLVDDVDGCHARLVPAGGRSVFPPQDNEWGTRRARVLDPEGGEWSFGTYEPGVVW
jgi:uncharacterized glyoxalase superfamily protein PhnB